MGPSGRLPELRISFCREIRNSAGSELTDLSLLPFPFLSSSHSSSLFSPRRLLSPLVRPSCRRVRVALLTRPLLSAAPLVPCLALPLLHFSVPRLLLLLLLLLLLRLRLRLLLLLLLRLPLLPSSSLFSRSLGPLAPLLLASFHSALPRVSGEGCSGRNQCRFPTASSAAGRRHWLPGFGGT